jgi:flavin reductase (DIM6/NTAB) family NADH-FMN oxidoreductase RutF
MPAARSPDRLKTGLTMTIHAAPTAIDPHELRTAMSRFATGVAVVTTFDGEKREGLTVNSFSSLSLDPPLVVWSLRKNSPSLATFQRATGFAVNILCADRRELSHHFATPHSDKFLGVEYDDGSFGFPVFSDNLALFECRKSQVVEGGDHLMFIGEVLRVTYRDDVPLIFSSGRYCTPLAIPSNALVNTGAG